MPNEFNIKNGFITSGNSFVFANLNVTGNLNVTTVSATTYLNLPSSGGGTFTGGTVTGATIFTGGLSANTISATTATIRRITGGSGNTNSGIYSFIGGGTGNTITASTSCFSSISSGIRNTVSCANSFVGSGSGNTIGGDCGFIGTGLGNCVSVVGYSSVVNGIRNLVSGTYSLIGSGSGNCVSTTYSFVGTGFQNQITSSSYSSIGSGCQNTLQGSFSSIAGGGKNTTNSGYYGFGFNSIGGGRCNNISADFSTISGGYKNTLNAGCGAFIGGGVSNSMSGPYGYNQGSVIVGGCTNSLYRAANSAIVAGGSNSISAGPGGNGGNNFIGGGYLNIICSNQISGIIVHSTISGGYQNSITNSSCSSIIGGRQNIISGSVSSDFSTISGGYCNRVRCTNSFIGGGTRNTITGNFSSILGGSGNTVSGAYSSAVGCGLTAISARTFYTNNIIVSGTSTSQSTTTALDFFSSQSVGDEGGEIRLAKSQTNTTLSGTSVTLDIFQNRLRFFESGGSNRGAFIDLTRASASVGTNLIVPRISSGVDSSGNTTAGAFTIVSSVIVPANTFATGDVVSFKMRMRKSGTNGTVNYRMSANSTLNLTGSQTIGVFNAGATIVYGELSRTLVVKGATSEVFNSSITNVQNDVLTSTSAVSSLSIDWTVDQYIMFNVNQSSNLDTTNISYYSILEI